jgi:hypothetical protein
LLIGGQALPWRIDAHLPAVAGLDVMLAFDVPGYRRAAESSGAIVWWSLASPCVSRRPLALLAAP